LLFRLKECHEHGGYLGYWIANTSELLYFIKQDRDISKISHDLQDRLAECVQRLFRYLTHLVQHELDKYLISLTNPQDDVERDVYIAFGKRQRSLSRVHRCVVLCVSEENGSINVKLSDQRWTTTTTTDTNANAYQQATLGDILATLSSVMDLLRKCRVNAALTIQMFSQIFHYINTWLCNRIVCCPELKLCSHFWGEKLSIRLKSVSDWAQRQGLELASDCHLTKVNQICALLQCSKRDAHDVQQMLCNTTFKLNSMQTTQILNHYVSNRNEPSISASFTQA
jgi:afadin